MWAAVHDLSYEMADEWRAELRLHWDDLLGSAKIGSHKDMVKKRWNTGNTQARVRAALEAAEAKKREHTKIGAMVLGLDEWNRLGRVIAKNPAAFVEQIDAARRVAAAVLKLEEANRLRAEGEAALAVSAFNEPQKLRK